MATRAGVLAFAVFFLLAATALARRPVDLQPQLDREAAAEKLPPKPVQGADAEAADQVTTIAVPDEEGNAIAVQEVGPAREETTQQRSSLLCLVFRCGCGTEPVRTGGVAVARRGRTHERQELDGWNSLAIAGTLEDGEMHGEEQGVYDSDSDWDSNSDWDYEVYEEDGIGGPVLEAGGWFLMDSGRR